MNIIWVGFTTTFLILCITLILFLRYFLHDFLTPNSAIANAELLVVEGWMSDNALKGAIIAFENGTYSTLITVGGPIVIGSYLTQYETLAEIAAASLLKMGGDPAKIVAVPSENCPRDRTAKTAETLLTWIQVNHLTIRKINLYSSGVHGRRSWFLYKRTFEPAIKVGIISAKPTTYDPDHWWQSSAGFKGVLTECIALIYAWTSS